MSLARMYSFEYCTCCTNAVMYPWLWSHRKVELRMYQFARLPPVKPLEHMLGNDIAIGMFGNRKHFGQHELSWDVLRPWP